MFSSPRLERPVRLDVWKENARLLAALQPATAPDAARAHRESIAIGMFWGPGAASRLATGVPTATWAIEEAGTQATLYLPTSTKPALLVFTRGWLGATTNTLGDTAVAILRRHGIALRDRRS